MAVHARTTESLDDVMRFAPTPTSELQIPTTVTASGVGRIDGIEREIRIENLRWALRLWLSPPQRTR